VAESGSSFEGGSTLGQSLKNEYFGSKKTEHFQCGPKKLSLSLIKFLLGYRSINLLNFYIYTGSRLTTPVLESRI
jgi:hypothetical protein